MIQLLLIVVPCTLVGAAAVLLADRGGLLPRLDQMRYPSTGPRRAVGPGRPLALAAIVIMTGWILFWLAALGFGIRLIVGAG